MIGKLKQAGINVPDGFATTADAHWKFLEANDLTDRLAAELAELKADGSNLARIGKSVRKMIFVADFPDPWRKPSHAAFSPTGPLSIASTMASTT